MIVWLASYPRSGNTLLRHALERLYGVRTWSVYHDYANQSLLPGWRRWPVDARGRSQVVDFVKTHGVEESTGDEPAVHLVRDGRDAIVSHAHLLIEHGNVALKLRQMLEQLVRGEGWNWSEHCKAWECHQNAYRLRFEDLVADPLGETRKIVKRMGLDLDEVEGAAVDSFESMQADNPVFFRSGKVGNWQEHFDEELHALFWRYHGEAMREMGYHEGALCASS